MLQQQVGNGGAQRGGPLQGLPGRSVQFQFVAVDFQSTQPDVAVGLLGWAIQRHATQDAVYHQRLNLPHQGIVLDLVSGCSSEGFFLRYGIFPLVIMLAG